MGKAVVVYDKELIITVDEDDLKNMSALKLLEIIDRVKSAYEAGKNDFYSDATFGSNPNPICLNKEEN